MTETLGHISHQESVARLRSDAGLRLRMGPFTVAIHSKVPEVGHSVYGLYADYPLVSSSEFTDFSVEIKRPLGVRGLWKPQVTFGLDGSDPFNPLPGDQGFPLLEWGLNWCVYSMCHQYLILHGAILERGGKALIMPAPSGSGKSTLCAALLFNGWRLMSDELTLICPKQRNLISNPRPVSLKNESVNVIADFVPGISFGSKVHETVKGVVAHFKAPSDSVARSNERALPGWIVLPRYRAGAATSLKVLEKSRTVMHLIENAFNYDVFGEEGFEMLCDLVDRSSCYSFEYSNLTEALVVFSDLSKD
jgi:HprK-related kinase A